MNKHTPGPWTVTKETRVQAGDIIFRQEHSVGKTYEELDANARLIAAAPELLEALAEPCRYHHLPLVNGWAHSIDVGTGTRKKTIRCLLSKKARAVITKATG